MAVSPQFLEFLDSLTVAILIDDDYGVCLFTNEATDRLLGHERGALVDRSCWDIANADRFMIEREHHRLLQDGFWWGEYGMRTAEGGVVNVRSVAFTRTDLDAQPVCVHLLYAQPPARRPASRRHMCLAEHLCVLQLMTEGFSDAEMSIVLGREAREIEELVRRAVAAVGARSRTEACIRALKAHLVC